MFLKFENMLYFVIFHNMWQFGHKLFDICGINFNINYNGYYIHQIH
jgi:hypothetical protein